MAAPPLMLAGVHSPARVAAALVLFTMAPGSALLWAVGPRRAQVEIGLVVAVSLAVSALAAQTMLWLGDWRPVTAACVLAGVCLASIAAQLAIGPLRGLRRRAG